MRRATAPIRVKTTRRVKNLQWAELREYSPFNRGGKKRKVKNSSFQRGLAYERVVGRHLKSEIQAGHLGGTLVLSQWILFLDKNGYGWAQIDAFILPPPDSQDVPILLIEAKLTQTDSATAQLISLYLPLLRKIYNRPVVCLQVCKNLRHLPNKFVESPREVLENPGPGVFTWHFPAL